MSRPFDRAVARLTPHERDWLEQVLQFWELHSSRGRKIVPNIRSLERFLSDAGMEIILRALSKVSAKDVAEIESKHGEACRLCVLLGQPVLEDSEYPLPAEVGRAVDRDRFVAWLFKHHGPRARDPRARYFLEVAQVEDFVSRLVQGTAPVDVERGLEMSAFGCWVTWCAKAPASPFWFLKQYIADEARAFLGLDPQMHDEVLLFCFSTADLPTLLRPTIGDAGLFEYFRPAPDPFELHGWTDPWTDGFALTRPTPVTNSPTPQPEAVHPKTTFDVLQGPVVRLP